MNYNYEQRQKPARASVEDAQADTPVTSGSCIVLWTEVVRSDAHSAAEALMELARSRRLPVVRIFEPTLERDNEGRPVKVLRPAYEPDPAYIVIREEMIRETDAVRFRWKRKPVLLLSDGEYD